LSTSIELLRAGVTKIWFSRLKYELVGKYQTLEGYISKDIYIPYPIQKSLKRIFPYPIFEWDMLKDIISLI
jgi:hypothetical protein